MNYKFKNKKKKKIKKYKEYRDKIKIEGNPKLEEARREWIEKLIDFKETNDKMTKERMKELENSINIIEKE